MKTQPAITSPVLPHGRFLIFNRIPQSSPEDIIEILKSIIINDRIVVGLGYSLQKFLNQSIEGFRPFPSLESSVNIPATHGDLFIFIKDNDPGDITLKSLDIVQQLLPGFDLIFSLNGFRFGGGDGIDGKDLTGYEDGTENPEGDELERAIIRDDNYCFVATQQWMHDLALFQSFDAKDRDHIIGRSCDTNEELDDAPKNAHIKRTDQATFDIEAHILRRSLPFSDSSGEGLMFMTFCSNLDRFEVQLKRMAGIEDGVVDALFRFSEPVTGAYFCCPPVESNRLAI